jgi:hypothetical protein
MKAVEMHFVRAVAGCRMADQKCNEDVKEVGIMKSV